MTDNTVSLPAYTPAHRGPDGDPPRPEESRRSLKAPSAPSDQFYRTLVRFAGLGVFVIMGLIAAFLAVRAWTALKAAGWHFFTEQRWTIAGNHFGIAAILPDGVFIALIALCVAVPISLATALFISEYAPQWMRRPLISIVDLMAAVPSIVYGLVGLGFLQPRIIGPIRFIANHLAFIPIFKVRTGDFDSSYTQSTAIAGFVVGLMIVPIATSLSREVISQAPVGEREGAYALGSTKLGMIRSVVLPYAKGGMIGAVMLGFGRAMGETITIALIVSPIFKFNYHVLEGGGISISSLIALRFGDSSPFALSTLMAAGLVLFVITLLINMAASVIINRSRAGASTT